MEEIIDYKKGDLVVVKHGKWRRVGRVLTVYTDGEVVIQYFSNGAHHRYKNKSLRPATEEEREVNDP